MILDYKTVTTDGLNFNLPCYVNKDNERWNGWINPYLTEDNFKKYLNQQLKWQIENPYYFENLDFIQSLIEIGQNPIEVNIHGWDKTKLFYLGGFICWQYVEEGKKNES